MELFVKVFLYLSSLVDEDTGGVKFEIVMGVDAKKLKDFYLEPKEGRRYHVPGPGAPLFTGEHHIRD